MDLRSSLVERALDVAVTRSLMMTVLIEIYLIFLLSETHREVRLCSAENTNDGLGTKPKSWVRMCPGLQGMRYSVSYCLGGLVLTTTEVPTALIDRVFLPDRVILSKKQTIFQVRWVGFKPQAGAQQSLVKSAYTGAELWIHLLMKDYC